MMVELRRTLVAALYDKVVRLSVKSLAETNSGKLISLISGDLYEIERGAAFFNMSLASPFINLICYGILVDYMGWLYTGMTLVFWVLLMLTQTLTARWTKYYKA